MIRLQKIKILKSFFNPDTDLGLELGPHVNPMFRKSEGYRVQYLELRGSDELRALMQSQGRDPNLVEDIDFILQRDRPLPEIVGGKRFAWVVSSHVIEHIPNFAGHLLDISAILQTGGVYALLVPDRNYCFDVLKPPTSLGAVIEAFLNSRTSSPIARLVDEFRYGAFPEGVEKGGWSEADSGKSLVSKYPDWLKRVRRVIDSKGADAGKWFGHQWCFDPVNFASIVADLIDLKLIDLELVHVRPTYHMDFIVVLRKTASARSASAREISRRMQKIYRRPVIQVSA